VNQARLRRLESLERRLLRPVFKFPDPKACAAELLTQIEWHETNHRAVKAGRASALAPWPTDVTVPDHIAAELQHIHDRLMSAERRAAESKRAAKRARRAARRLAAAVEKPEPVPRTWAAFPGRTGARAGASGAGYAKADGVADVLSRPVYLVGCSPGRTGGTRMGGWDEAIFLARPRARSTY
jgi:hypothetical protein